MNMLDTLKHTGKTLGREINRTWDNLSEGWRELRSRSSESLTHFTHRKDADPQIDISSTRLPQWSLLAGELEETGKDVLVRIELPGMDKEDCKIFIEGNTLHLSGEKRFERETDNSTYHIMERAYGTFQRSIPLPRNVDVDQAVAKFKNGVLTVRLPKIGGDSAKSIPVS